MSRAIEISDAAAEWLIRLEAQTSPEMWEAFDTWLNQDPRHRAAFIRLRVAWNRVDRLKVMRPDDGAVDADLLARTRITPADIEAQGAEPERTSRRKRLDDLLLPDRRRVLATAAAIAATGVFAWFGAYHLGFTPYVTVVGQREEIPLADGSTVHLNTSTELEVRISNSRREIRMSRGEALFNVAHDPKRPFYVVAGGTVVRAVGTAFVVRLRDTGHVVEVLVTEGRVAVGPPDTEANFENPRLLERAPKVSAGEAATVRRNFPVAVRAVSANDIHRRLAWTAGYLDFQGETLEDAVEEFNRYTEHKIRIADPSILNKQVGGYVSTNNPEGFIAALQKSLAVRIEIDEHNGDIRLFGGEQPP